MEILKKIRYVLPPKIRASGLVGKNRKLATDYEKINVAIWPILISGKRTEDADPGNGILVQIFLDGMLDFFSSHIAIIAVYLTENMRTGQNSSLLTHFLKLSPAVRSSCPTAKGFFCRDHKGIGQLQLMERLIRADQLFYLVERPLPGGIGLPA
jgi:hypothetical protein